MRRILRQRPSPAMVVALAALGVALGGVAFATIPDSTGTIHGCYQKANGNLRVVESASDCRTNETAISWNQEGQPGSPGSGVAARLRGGPVDATGFKVTKDVSFSPTNTWIQGPNEFQELQVTIDVKRDGFCSMVIRVSLDGEQIKTIYLDATAVLFRDLDNRSFDFPVFESGVERSHSLSAEITSDTGTGCGDRFGGTLESLKVDVLGFR